VLPLAHDDCLLLPRISPAYIVQRVRQEPEAALLGGTKTAEQHHGSAESARSGQAP
jgi:hypothetical protein